GSPLGVARAAVQLSERVRLHDHHCAPVTEAGREPADPLLVRLLVVLEPTVRRVVPTSRLHPEEQIPQRDEHEKYTRRDHGDHSPTDPPKPSHGWEYSPDSCSTVTTGVTSV